jgi:GNAT superfamily N-acetyltransferase
MNDPTPLRLERYDAAGTLRLADEISTVYLAAHQELQDNPWYSPAKFWERLEQLYAPIPGFELTAGWADDELVGYAFGSPFRRPETVWNKAIRVFPQLAPKAPDEPVYMFREFAVHPHHQGNGYARIIHDALLSERPERLAYLLVRVGNRARQLYESWGWHAIGRTQPFADSPVMDEMARTTASESA